MKRGISIAVVLVCGLAARQFITAQAPSSPSQSKPSNQPKPAASNPFPEDTNDVPVMPNGNAPAVPDVPTKGEASTDLPKADVDPVRSPDDARDVESTAAQGFSSSSSGLDRYLPPPDTDSHGGKNGQIAPEHQESAAEDEKVGDYYLSTKNWKAALSRYESAVVLDPENPDVYWGLGEAQRHLGQFADAKASYEKLVEYDPDSRHGKEARKILKEPELANASTAKP